MIEESIAKLIASIDANTAALIALSNAPIANEPAPAPAKPAPVKAAAPKPAPKKAAPAPVVEEPPAEVDYTALASKAIEKLLKANKRNEAIALLTEFEAQKASDIADDQVPAFIEAAEAILLAA